MLNKQLMDGLAIMYRRMPPSAQNVGISLFGAYWRWERLGGDFPEHVRGFRVRDGWSAEQFREFLNDRLRRVTLSAFDNVPYYRKAWSSAGVQRVDLDTIDVSTLSRLPILRKDVFRSAPHDFLARDRSSSGRLRKYETSGSSGTPVVVTYTVDVHRQFLAAREVRSFGWAGVSIRQPRATMAARQIVASHSASGPFHRINLAERQVYLSSFHISPETARSYVDALNSHRPALFTGYAGAFYNLAKVCLAESLALEYRPKAIVLVGERVTPEMAKTISSAFGARVWEEYGCVENCLLATQCEAGGLHVSSDVGIVEILDEDDRPVGPGVEGRVVCTSLLNGVQPLVRYELGDVAVWRKDKCPCGRDQFPLIGEVVGRIGDGLVTPDGRFVDKVHTIFTGVEHIHRGQIVQESLDKIVLNVVPAPGFSEVDRLTLVRRIAERIGAVQIELRLIPEIPTTRAGKFKMVISHLPDKVRKENTVGDGNAPSSQDLLQGSVS